MNAIRTLLAAACVALLATPVAAAGGGKEAPARQWAHSGLFGTFDRAALRRGARVYMEVCSACHGLRLVAYRNLMEIGFSENEVKKIAAEKEVPAEPNDEGEVELRPACLRWISSCPLSTMKTLRGQPMVELTRLICP